MKIDKEFKSLIPPLGDEELTQLEMNQLGFSGTRFGDGNVESLDLWPTPIGSLWWIWVHRDLRSNSETYSKTPMACSRMPIASWRGFDLKSVAREAIDNYPPETVDRILQRSFIYFIQQGERGPVKIGRASHPQSRLAMLQCGNPNELRIVRTIETDRPSLEFELHAKFAAHHIRGEWFSSEVLSLLAEVRCG